MSDVLRVDPDAPSPGVLDRVAAVLRRGGLVAFPTETVYGLGALFADRAALRAVFEAKGRPRTDPLIVHVADVDGALGLVEAWPSTAAALADAFWPGPLTLVLARSAAVPDEVTAGGPSVGVRVPAHPVALGLIRAVGSPIAAPSANRFGRISPTQADHVLAELDGAVDVILDGGPTPLGIESTVVELAGERPRVLRHGGITVEDLMAVIGPIEAPERRVVADGEAASAPGQLLGHYAPATPVVLVEGSSALADQLVTSLCAGGVIAARVPLPTAAADAAPELYRALRAADESGAEVLVAGGFSGGGLGRALNDRLFRAAHGRVVTDASDATVARVLRSAARR